jgi:hypothetical protein
MAKAAKKTAARLDPAPRPIDGAIPYFQVKNKDPDRFYIWVNKAAQDFGLEHYLYLGYEMERYRDGGPCPAMVVLGKEDGAVIESRGNVLVSISKESHDELTQNGTDGVSGQRAADLMERRLLDRTKHEKDSMRGINPRNRNGDSVVSVEFDRGAYASIPVGDEDG